MKRFQLFVLLMFSCVTLMSQEKQVVVPYTLTDRDRAIQIEARLNALEINMNIKFESMNAKIETKFESMNAKFENVNVKFESLQIQIDDLRTLFYWGFGILITLFLFMFGYLIWDRRTAMKPALALASRAEDNSRTLIETLREYSKHHPDLAEILRSRGIL